MKVVLDTNIVVSGLLQSQGNPAQVLTLALSGAIQTCHDGRILAEYAEVLSSLSGITTAISAPAQAQAGRMRPHVRNCCRFMPLRPPSGQALAIARRPPAQGIQPLHESAHARTAIVAEERFEQL